MNDPFTLHEKEEESKLTPEEKTGSTEPYVEKSLHAMIPMNRDPHLKSLPLQPVWKKALLRLNQLFPVRAIRLWKIEDSMS